MHLRTGRVVALEGLLRVQVDGAAVPPDVHLSGLAMADLVEVARWVRRRAFADAARLLGSASRRTAIAVNVDARETADPSWADDVLKDIAAAGLTPPDVTLELTEAASFAQHDAVQVLRRLAYAGLQIALDDVGTGYNALALLEALPVTALKIDRRFVTGMSAGTTSAAIVRALTTIAHELGMRVTAEGIESEEQVTALVAMGVDHGQGFLLARPMPAAELPFFLDERNADGPALEAVRVLHLTGASPATIAAALNSQGFRTGNGLRWTRDSVLRALDRLSDPDQ